VIFGGEDRAGYEDLTEGPSRLAWGFVAACFGRRQKDPLERLNPTTTRDGPRDEHVPVPMGSTIKVPKVGTSFLTWRWNTDGDGEP
jgi:hypothetical protein